MQKERAPVTSYRKVTIRCSEPDELPFVISDQVTVLGAELVAMDTTVITIPIDQDAAILAPFGEILESCVVSSQESDKYLQATATPVICGEFSILPVLSPSPGQSCIDPKTIALIPGMGWGTGQHPATQLILSRIASLPPPLDLLDVGCGSAVLSIAAAKLWPECSILAIDNEEQALVNAADNLKLNEVQEQVTLLHASALPEHASCDCLVANLYAELLADYEPQFRKAVPPGGIALLCGIMSSLLWMVDEAYQSNWTILESAEQEGWCLLKLQRGS